MISQSGLTLTVNDPDQILQPGSVVTGNVHLSLANEEKISRISVKLEGISHTLLKVPKNVPPGEINSYLNYSDSSDSDSPNINESRRKKREKRREKRREKKERKYKKVEETHKFMYLMVDLFPPKEIIEAISSNSQNSSKPNKKSEYKLAPGSYTYDFSLTIPNYTHCEAQKDIITKVSNFIGINASSILLNSSSISQNQQSRQNQSSSSSSNYNHNYNSNEKSNKLDSPATLNLTINNEGHMVTPLPPILKMGKDASIQYFIKATVARTSYLPNYRKDRFMRFCPEMPELPNKTNTATIGKRQFKVSHLNQIQKNNTNSGFLSRVFNPKPHQTITSGSNIYLDINLAFPLVLCAGEEIPCNISLVAHSPKDLFQTVNLQSLVFEIISKTNIKARGFSKTYINSTEIFAIRNVFIPLLHHDTAVNSITMTKLVNPFTAQLDPSIWLGMKTPLIHSEPTLCPSFSICNIDLKHQLKITASFINEPGDPVEKVSMQFDAIFIPPRSLAVNSFSNQFQLATSLSPNLTSDSNSNSIYTTNANPNTNSNSNSNSSPSYFPPSFADSSNEKNQVALTSNSNNNSYAEQLDARTQQSRDNEELPSYDQIGGTRAVRIIKR